MSALDPMCAPRTASLLDVVARIDHGAHGVCFMVDEDGVLVGLMTDGDVRRALLSGVSLDAPALPFATKRPRTVDAGTRRAMVLDLMRSLKLAAVPEVDGRGRLVGLHTLAEMVGHTELPHTAVIMAGGRGTRLGELTRHTPKPLMPVAGRPIIEWIILGLVSGGVRRVVVAVNHMAEQIVEHLGDGSALGCHVDYVHEEPDRPLGTAGALSLLARSPAAPSEPLIVMNGDLMVEFEPADLLGHHVSTGAAVTVGVKSYDHTVPFGVVETEPDGRVTSITEKPTLSLAINAAVYAVDPTALQLLPFDQPSTMPDLVRWCIDEGKRVSAWTLSADWADIGTPADLARAKGDS